MHFHQLQQLYSKHHGATFVFLCVSVLFVDNARYQFAIVRYVFPMVLSYFFAEKFLSLSFICNTVEHIYNWSTVANPATLLSSAQLLLGTCYNFLLVFCLYFPKQLDLWSFLYVITLCNKWSIATNEVLWPPHFSAYNLLLGCTFSRNAWQHSFL